MSFLIDVLLFSLGVFVLFILLRVLYALVHGRHEDQRWAELAVWAEQNGLRFNAKEDRSINYRFPFFSLPKGDGDRYAFNIMEGAFRGWHVCAFDYFWLIDNGVQDSSPRFEYYWRSYIAVDVGVPLEPLSLDPVRFVGKSTPISEQEKTRPGSGEFVGSFFLPCPGEIRLDCEFYGTQIVATGLGRGPQGRFSAKDFGCALHVLADMLDDNLGPAVREEDGVGSEV